MIRDVDESVAAWLRQLVPGVTVTFEPPGRGAPDDPGASLPRLSVFLATVREDADGSTAGWGAVYAEDGPMVGRLPPLRRYRFCYLLVAEGADALAEHDTLGRVLAGAAHAEVVPTECLQGVMAHAEGNVIVRCAPSVRSLDPQHLWSAWGAAPRTSVELSVLAPLPLAAIQSVAPPPKHIDVGIRRRPVAPSAEPARSVRPRPSARIEES